LTGVGLFALVATFGSFYAQHPGMKVLAAVAWLLVVFVLYFFRAPERAIPADEKAIVSPADGRVIEVREVTEQEFLQGTAIQVSIFLSLFDVHVNRIPMSGRVTYYRYEPGRFHVASKPRASVENEHTAIGIESPSARLLFKQVAGILARRIVCSVREGQEVRRGQRFGMIKFGSRVDVFLPPSVTLGVRVGQKVKGGETIIGALPS